MVAEACFWNQRATVRFWIVSTTSLFRMIPPVREARESNRKGASSSVWDRVTDAQRSGDCCENVYQSFETSGIIVLRVAKSRFLRMFSRTSSGRLLKGCFSEAILEEVQCRFQRRRTESTKDQRTITPWQRRNMKCYSSKTLYLPAIHAQPGQERFNLNSRSPYLVSLSRRQSIMFFPSKENFKPCNLHGTKQL